MRVKPGHILVPAVALVGFWALSLARAAGTLSFYISSIDLSFSGITPVIRINLIVQNPSGTSFTIRSITGNLYSTMETRPIGSVSMFDTIVIAANSQSILPIYVRLNAMSVVSDLLTLIQRGSGNPQSIKLDGYVNANGIVHPLDLDYKIN